MQNVWTLPSSCAAELDVATKEASLFQTVFAKDATAQCQQSPEANKCSASLFRTW
jgi:hypothetical protein